MAILEYMDTTGTRYYDIPPDDLQQCRNWKMVDCGCAGYAAARKALAPAMKDLAKRIPLSTTIPLTAEKLRFIDAVY